MKTLLVSLAHIDQVDDVIETAAYIGRKCDSHVIGFFPIPGPTIVAVTHPGGYLPLDDRIQKYYLESAALVREKFETRMKKDGLRYEWREVRLQVSDITNAIVMHGRETDLILLSQDNYAGPGSRIDIRIAAETVLSAGRPVLIVPPLNGRQPSLAKTVIGWNASREACRAAFDSLALIKHSDEVHLTWVNPEKTLGKGGKLPGTELAAALARHDVKAITKGLSNRSKPGPALLNYVKDQDADLLVMGAYGRSRLNERILGGATEDILKHMSVPVLLSN